MQTRPSGGSSWPLCRTAGCLVDAVHPLVSMLIAATVTGVIFYVRLSELELSYHALEAAARANGKLAVPTMLIDSLRQKYEWIWMAGMVVVICGAAFVHGVWVRHRKIIGVVFGAAGVPAALISVMFIAAKYLVFSSAGN